MPTDGLDQGSPKAIPAIDSECRNARVCPDCGAADLRTSLNAVIVKIGTLDDPSLYGGRRDLYGRQTASVCKVVCLSGFDAPLVLCTAAA